MSPRVANQVLLLLLVMMAVRPPQLAAQPVAQNAADRLEATFVERMTSRLLFEQAEQHCREQLQILTDAERTAFWTGRLCHVYRQHAWFAVAANRNSLLTQAAESVTQFLQTNVVAPETELWLRADQIATLAQMAEVARVLDAAGHLSRPQGSARDASESPQVPEAITTGLELASALLDQLQKLRRELDYESVREIRDQVRLLLAELSVRKAQALASAGTPADAVRGEAEELLRTLVRSATSPAVKAQARWLEAELALLANDTDMFQLRLRSLEMHADDLGGRSQESLRIRGLLQSNQPTEAIAIDADPSAGSVLHRQRLLYLHLESRLALFELVHQLDDAEVRDRAAADFRQSQENILPRTRGVFHEASRRVSARFRLVESLGPQLADQIETADRFQRAGDVTAAVQLIESTLQQLREGAPPRATAALQLRSGELLVQQQEWSRGRQRLQAATDGFAALGMPAEAATADLLRVFAIGQVWQATVASGADPEAVEADYRVALQQHLERFADLPTATRARQWLVKLLQQQDPLTAAEIAIGLAEAETSPQQQLKYVQQAGELLLSVVRGRVDDSDARSEECFRSFRTMLARFDESTPALPPADIAAARLVDLQLELQFTNSGANDEAWRDRATRLQQIRDALQNTPSTADPMELRSHLRRVDLLQFVSIARTTADAAQLRELQGRLLAQDLDWQWRAMSYLHSLYSGATRVAAGDLWLADTSAKLAQAVLTSAGDDEVTADELVALFAIAASAAEINGDTELRDTLLQRLASLQLTPTQLRDVAVAFADWHSTSDAGSPIADQFWSQLLKASAQGSDAWLEASLQLAQLAFDRGRSDDAKRRLAVVELLHPDWGSPDRKQRAGVLEQQCRSSPVR